MITTLERKFVIKVVNNTTKWIDVRAGFNMGGKQEVFGELNEGDTLVAKANEELKPDTKIGVNRSSDFILKMKIMPVRISPKSVNCFG